MPSTARKSRLSRGALTKQKIVETALALLDERGVSGFSLPALGRALNADQTAVYRHYASKDDLIRAVADHLLLQASIGFEATQCWRETLAELCQCIFAVYRRHPAAGSLSGSRTTAGPGERELAECFMSAILAAGFQDRQAVLQYRVCVDFALFWAAGHAGYLALDPGARAQDRSFWATEYQNAEPARYPSTALLKHRLVEVESDEIFSAAITLLLDGLERQAPKKCQCRVADETLSNPHL